MKVSPRQLVQDLLGKSNGRCGIYIRASSFAGIMGYATLDQDRRGVRPQRQHGEAKCPIETRGANALQLLVLSNLYDRSRRKGSLFQFRLLDLIRRYGGMEAIGNAPPYNELVASAKVRELDFAYVNAIVRYLLQVTTYPEDNLGATIEDAKAFAWLSREQYGVSKIAQVWESYKLVAPYLYALNLENMSIGLGKVERLDDLVDWIEMFASSPRRVARFLGHAAFVMDRLSGFAREQCTEDFEGVDRWQSIPSRLSPIELEIYRSIDRRAENYGQSFGRTSKLAPTNVNEDPRS